MQARNGLRLRGRLGVPTTSLLAAMLSAGAGATLATAEPWPTRVNAIYKIQFAGIELGKFEFESKVQSNAYSLASNAHISAMFGAYEWRGQSKSSGMAALGGPKPASYTFNFKNQSKTGTINMTFSENVVVKVVAQPPSESKPGTIPLRDGHLKDVLDPLSAVMALTRTSSGRIAGVNPCGRKVPIFDGKQRFDLILGFKRSAALSELGSSNPGRAYVCRVKYVPVAGYRLNDEVRQMMNATDIEVWMVPVAEADMFLPYHVVIPTGAGTATMTASKVGIETARGRVSLSQ